jgi:hypothetical protein
MTMKSLLLGAAAGLVTVGAAQAADLPMTKAEAVEYVKVCTEFGAGFFYIPGSDTCLKIGGLVRADYRFVETNIRADDGVRFGSRGQITFDARTQTEYGLLRSFIAFNGDTGPGSANAVTVDKAYIQFGGLTAGYAHSFFGIYDAEYANDIWAPYYTFGNDFSTRNLLAYTATFGGGFSATLAVEDGKSSRSSNVIINDTTGLVDGYSGLTAPDVVGNLRVDQAWGKASIFAASHQLRAGNNTAGTLNVDAKYGYAAGAALAVNLPIAAGGHAVVEATYASGALTYLGLGSSTDWEVSSANGNKLSHGWAIAGELGVNVTPAFTINVLGSYADVKIADPLGDGATSATDASFKIWTASVNGWYTITPGLKIGVEVGYVDKNFKPTLSTGGTIISDVKGWQGGMRIQRNF